MPNLEAQAAWVPVREIGIELARGGPNGNMNEQAKALLARTEYLNQEKANKAEIIQGIHEFDTYALFDAAKSSLPLNCTVVIGEKNTTGTGQWDIGNNSWNGVILKKSSYDPLEKAKNDATAKANEAQNYTLNEVSITYSKIDDSLKQIELKKTTDDSVIPVLVDSSDKVLIGYDTANDKVILAGFNQTTDIENNPSEINHMLFYGQSLSVGANATTILSTSQPYSNLTFDSGPRMQYLTANSIKPLVEDALNPSPDGSTNRGETACSGAANYASRAMMLQNSINPSKHIIFASTAGRGGYKISQLEKGTAWYPNLIKHVEKAKQLCFPKTYKVSAIPCIQGESDTDGTIKKEEYKQKLIKLQKDAEADIKAITNQISSVPFITYQLSARTRLTTEICLAHLELVQENDNFLMSTPMYQFQYSDGLHLISSSYKWLGAYIGRAYKQYVIDKRKPDFINPKLAKIVGSTVEIEFDVPKSPLVFDTTALAVTTNHGFKVTDGVNDSAISSITTNSNKVIITLASAPATDLKIRYALDYMGTGLTMENGASGNLRDSTTDTVVINGVTRPLWHLCPHFELTAFIDKGI